MPPKPAPPSLYPTELDTLGNWIRKTRLDRELTQAQVGILFGVAECRVTNWELGPSEPEIHYYPKITAFIGYCPYVPTTDLVERGEGRSLRFGTESGAVGRNPTSG